MYIFCQICCNNCYLQTYQYPDCLQLTSWYVQFTVPEYGSLLNVNLFLVGYSFRLCMSRVAFIANASANEPNINVANNVVPAPCTNSRLFGSGIADNLGLFFIMLMYLLSSVNVRILASYLGFKGSGICICINYKVSIHTQQQMQTQIIQIQSTYYYTLTHKPTNLCLYLPPQSKNLQKQKIILQQLDEQQIGQIWMLVEVAPQRYPNMYQIVHTISTLVITAEKDYMGVKFGKWRSNQLYFLQRANIRNKPNQFWIKDGKESNRYMVAQGGRVFMKETNKPDDNCVWVLSIARNNKDINRSCYIQYAFSNMVLDVPKASDKPGTAICQYPCNNRFNQRWNIIKVGQYYRIQNMKTQMCLDIKGESKKPGGAIIQWKSTGSKNQLWILEYQGKNLYMIRSAMDANLLLSVKDNSLKQCADIVTTNDDSQCFWRIVGYVPE